MIDNFFIQSIQIQLGTPSQSSIGGQTITWTTVATVSGYIDLKSGKTDTEANKTISDSTHTMYSKIGLALDKEKMYRMYYNGDYYRVLYYDEVFGHHSEIYLKRSGVDN